MDVTAFEQVFDNHFDEIYRYLYRHIGHADTAQELAAEVFTRLVEAIEARRAPKGNIRAWLYRVAHNLFIDEMRKQAYRNHDVLTDRVAGGQESVEQQTARGILQAQARVAMSRIPARQEMALSLKYLEGLDTAEIAVMLEITEAAVRVLLARGRKALHTELMRQGALTEGSGYEG